MFISLFKYRDIKVRSNEHFWNFLQYLVKNIFYISSLVGPPDLKTATTLFQRYRYFKSAKSIHIYIYIYIYIYIISLKVYEKEKNNTFLSNNKENKFYSLEKSAHWALLNITK